MVGFDCSLVGAEQPALGERGNAVHTRQEAVCLLAGDNVTLVDIVVLRRRTVGLEAVGDDRRAFFDMVDQEPVQGVCGEVRDRRHATATEGPRVFALDSDHHQGLLAF
jgi:hypothetical protein